MHAVADVHDTPVSVAAEVLGNGCTVQPVPSQRSASVAELPLLSLESPAAVQASAAVHETPFSSPNVASEGSGVGWMVQPVASHRSAIGALVPPLRRYEPTAVHTVPVHEMP